MGRVRTAQEVRRLQRRAASLILAGLLVCLLPGPLPGFADVRRPWPHPGPWPLAAAAVAAWWACLLIITLLFFLGHHADVPAEEAFHRHRLPCSERRCTPGGKVHLLRWATGQRRGMDVDVRIICLHGTFDSGHAFATWAEALVACAGPETSVEVLAPDLPGHGLTGPWLPPSQHPGREADVAFLHEVVTGPAWGSSSERAGLQPRVVLVGHSLGAAVAIAYAALHPEFVQGLVLMAPWGLEYRAARPEEWEQCSPLISLGLSPRLRPLLEPVLGVARYVTPLPLVQLVARTAFGSGGGGDCEAGGEASTREVALKAGSRMHAMMLREGNRAALAQRIGQLVAEEAEHQLWRAKTWGHLRSLRCRVQLQWGLADHWLPASRARSFQEALASCDEPVDLRLFEGVGHCVAEQEPLRSAGVAWEHIRGCTLREA